MGFLDKRNMAFVSAASASGQAAEKSAELRERKYLRGDLPEFTRRTRAAGWSGRRGDHVGQRRARRGRNQRIRGRERGCIPYRRCPERLSHVRGRYSEALENPGRRSHLPLRCAHPLCRLALSA
jgi:hypothetical protein